MSKEHKKNKPIYRKLRNKYRLVIMNDQTLEERTSFRLSPINVFVATGITVMILIIVTIYLIAFTGLREYIPGYSDPGMKRKVLLLNLKSDSLERVIHSRELFLNNIKNIFDGNVEGKPKGENPDVIKAKYDTIRHLPKSREDSLLRIEMEQQDKYSLRVNEKKNSGISSFFFFAPVKGTVTNTFDQRSKHYGVDIVAPANEAIKATLDGMVVFSNFTTETGYVIGIQHGNNLFSLYKHNSSLLKKTGDFVKAGDVIAIIGNSGEQTTGPHLHFELWYSSSIDPQQYVTF
ncbi:MAG: M23 family metallopeptidase [Bacteroidia bacterium]|nr:M23 family metallopeptidase [Bacteroidia bacterium]